MYEVNDRVIIIKIKSIKQNAGTTPEMLETLGLWGRITDVNKNLGCMVQIDEDYELNFSQDFWYNPDGLANEEEYEELGGDDYEINDEEEQWFLSSITGNTYKFVRVDENGFSIYENSDGKQISSEFVALYPA